MEKEDFFTFLGAYSEVVLMEYGLLGEKLGHSFSPQIHRDLAGYDYQLLPTPPEAVEDLFAGGRSRGLTSPSPTSGW